MLDLYSIFNFIIFYFFDISYNCIDRVTYFNRFSTTSPSTASLPGKNPHNALGPGLLLLPPVQWYYYKSLFQVGYGSFLLVTHSSSRRKTSPRLNNVLSVGAEVVILRKQWGGGESSRWSERARLPNEVSLVAPSVKKPLLLSLLLSLKKGSSPIRSISCSIFDRFDSNIRTMTQF